MPMSNILPGLLYQELECSGIHRTPQADIPDFVRNSDPNMAFLPLVFLEWGDYQIHIGDKVIQLVCNMPYKGWDIFKERINSLLLKLKNSQLIVSAQRFSLKYMDIIEQVGSDISLLLDFNLKIGRNDFNLMSTQFRTEKYIDDAIIIMQIIGQASASFTNGKNKSGLLLDIDCIKNINDTPFNQFMDGLENDLDSLHHLNKVTFFNFLSEDGLNSLEPEYE